MSDAFDLDKLNEDGKTLLEEFGKLFGKTFAKKQYSVAVEKQAEDQEKSKKLLTHRAFDSVAREKDDLRSGYCFVRDGGGPGAMGSARKRYVVERSDYGIDIFNDEETYEKGKPAAKTIHPSGYTLVQTVKTEDETIEMDVSKHFLETLKPLAETLGLEEEYVTSMVTFSPHSWALCHPNRTNYIFQITEDTKSSGGGCCCGGGGGGSGKEDDIPLETADEETQRLDWVKVMETCMHKARPRNTDTVRAKSFEATFQKIPLKVECLPDDWKDDGTEEEILTDLLMDACIPSQRDSILAYLKNEVSGIIDKIPIPLPASITNKPLLAVITVWYKVRETIRAAVKKLIDFGWPKIQLVIDKIQSAIDYVLGKALTALQNLKSKMEDKIKNSILDKILTLLTECLQPKLIQPIINAFEKPLKDGFEHGRKILEEEVEIASLPKDTRHSILNKLPRRKETLRKFHEYSKDLKSSLEDLKLGQVDEDVLKEFNIDAQCAKTEKTFLEELDAAIYTIEVRFKEGTLVERGLRKRIVEEYDHDVMICKQTIIKDAVREILVLVVKKKIESKVQPYLDSFDEKVPDEMKDFLTVQNVYDHLVDVIVGEPINKMVEIAYPLE